MKRSILTKPACIFLFVFLFLSFVGLHGFSIGMWTSVLGEEANPIHLVGEARGIRSDDWAVELPMIMSQALHDPPYPRMNDKMGPGMDMLGNLSKTPVAHPLSLFRPTFWGFLFGKDVGLAWLWWALMLGIFASHAWLFRSLAPSGTWLLPAGGALLVIGSPVFSYWAYHYGEISAYGAAATASFLALLRSARAGYGFKNRAGWGLLAGWFAACMVLNIYPAFQVTLGYTYAFLLLGLLAQGLQAQEFGFVHLRRVIPALAFGGILAAAAVAWYLWEIRDLIPVAMGTDYPGQRFEVGGYQPWWRFFMSDLLLYQRKLEWGRLDNFCEGASPFALWFPCASLSALAMFRTRKVDWTMLGLAAAMALFFVFCVFGLPRWFVGITQLRHIPANRAMLAFSVAGPALMVRFCWLNRRDGDPSFSPRHWEIGIALLAWASLLVATTASLKSVVFPEARTIGMVSAFALSMVLAWSMAWSKFPQAARVGLWLVIAGGGLWFNPLVFRGLDRILSSPLALALKRVDAERGGKSTWVVFGDFIPGNLPRLLGFRAWNGTMSTPFLSTWKLLDPSGAARPAYNRFSHVRFEAREGPVEIFNPYSDQTLVRIPPDHPYFKALERPIFLVSPENQGVFAASGKFREAARAGSFAVYEPLP